MGAGAWLDFSGDDISGLLDCVVRDTHITPTVSKGWEGPISMDSYTNTSAEAAKVKREPARIRQEARRVLSDLPSLNLDA